MLGLALFLLLSFTFGGTAVLAPPAQAEWPGPGDQINSGNGDRPVIADIDGEPWVAYSEGPQGEDSVVLVKRLVGGVWTAVGGPLTGAGVSAVGPAITEIDGAAYVAWNEHSGSSDAVRVARWSGSSWEPVGASLLDPGAAGDLTAVTITSVGAAPAVPYVGFVEQPGGSGPFQAHVSRFVSGAWQPVGGALNTVPARDARNVRLATVAGAPVVAFDQAEDAAGTVTAHVARWDGAGWTPLGTSAGANFAHDVVQGLAAYNGAPALLHVDGSDGGQPSMTLSRWTGSDWVAVGTPLGSTTYATSAALTVSNGVPFVVWIYTTDTYYMTSARFNGAAWIATGEVPSAGTFGLSEPSLADVGGVANLVWFDWIGTGRLYHSQYASSGPTEWGRTWGGGVVSGDATLPEICTLPSSCRAGADGDAAGGIFSSPRGVALDSTGAVWVADEPAKRIQKFDAQGHFLLAMGKDVGGPGIDTCTVSAQCHYGENGDLGGQFTSPQGIATDPAGHVYVVDDRRIQELTSSGAFVRAFGRGVNGGDSFNVCTVAASCTRDLNPPSGFGGEFNFPYTVAVDDADHVYVGDTFRVQEFSASSTVPSDVTFLRTWGKDVIANGAGNTGFEVCTVASQCKDPDAGQLGGELSSTQGLAAHGGQIFVLDSAGNDRVQVFAADGSFERAWGQDVLDNGPGNTGFEVCTAAASCQAGTASSQPGALDVVDESNDGISVGPTGALYVADHGNDRVNVYGVDGSYLRTFGTSGTGGGQLTGPLSVEAGPDQEVAVVEKENDRVSLFFDSSATGATYAFSSASYSHTESGSQAVTVTRSGDTSIPGSVHYATANGTAVAGSDYTAASGDLSFAAGQASQTVDVAITSDALDEPDETVGLALSSPSVGDALGTPAAATLTIVDDDVPPPPPLDTVIDDGPAGETYVSTPAFTFHGTVAGSTFQCRLDGAAYAGCTVPYVAPVLGTGPHSFDVRAVSPAAEVDATPAHRAFSIGGAQTVSADCVLSPVTSDTLQNKPYTCRIGGHLTKCTGIYTCVHKDMDCPPGSRCTMTTTATWVDHDPKATWDVLARARHLADADQHRHDDVCHAKPGGHRCSVTVRDAGVVPVGAQPATVDWANAYCQATTTTSKSGLGDPGDRTLTCHGVLTYEPSQALQPVSSGAAVQLLVPGPGTVSISSSGAGRVAARGKAPSFATATQAVGAAGVVSFTPKLAKKLKKKFKHGKKVKVTVYATYRSPAGTVVRSSARVVLQKAAKTPKLPGHASGRIGLDRIAVPDLFW